MTLKKYISKRNLKKSKESKAASAKDSSSDLLRFCVQKHAARHLHYDFRLEHRGVLLSWAIPKGPSTNPKDKRLAIKVEDHPLDYQYFEGIIPKGHYGAGTVEIWDKGTFMLPKTGFRSESEKVLSEGLEKGHISVILNGEKLQGEYVFQKLRKDPEDNAWLLIKKEDAFADAELDLSHSRPLKKDKMPGFFSPMLATLIQEPFDHEDWLFEVKWDGYRALAYIDQGEVQLLSRTEHLLNNKFPEIVKELKRIKGSVILDGELVVLNGEGKSDFQLMQNFQKTGKGALFYYIFDLLYKDGEDLRERPLIERKEILKDFLETLSIPSIRFSGHILEEGKAFFKEAAKNQLEGIIGKKLSSVYQSKRSRDWVKVKTVSRQEVVICGFTEPQGSRQLLGALIVGVYDDKHSLQYAGHVGGGFNSTTLKDVYQQLKPLIQTKSPFKKAIKTNTKVTWVKPKLVCEVSFAEWTKDNRMRQPIFHGLRIDKPAKAVQKEVSTPMVNSEPKNTLEKKWQSVNLTHLEKVYWPEEKYTKGDLVEYYTDISKFILPHLKNRPIVLHRYPEGIEGNSFYQKNFDFTLPKGVKTCPIMHGGKTVNYLLINNFNSLLFAINLGSIDFHPFMSRYEKLEMPDFCVVDLDPHGIAFEEVVQVALSIHELFEEMKINHYCKTSGGNGLHITIPLHGKYDFQQAQQFVEIIALYVHQKFPATTSVERNPKKREKKIYIDFLQNRFSQTIVSPYSVRPRSHAPVSTPLLWNEVNVKLDPLDFNIKTVVSRLKEMGDIYRPVLQLSINIEMALKRLKKLIHTKQK